MRAWSLVFAIGLVVLWIAGLSSPGTAAWLTWLDGVAAICGFIIAGTVDYDSPRSARMGAPIALAVGLYALWIIGLATDGRSFQNWWSFGFACGFLLLGISAYSQPMGAMTPTSMPHDRMTRTDDRFRKRA